MFAFQAGVKAPMFVFAMCEEEIAQADSMLRYPLIVKHFNGYVDYLLYVCVLSLRGSYPIGSRVVLMPHP